jgi:hypothetical protein
MGFMNLSGMLLFQLVRKWSSTWFLISAGWWVYQLHSNGLVILASAINTSLQYIFVSCLLLSCSTGLYGSNFDDSDGYWWGIMNVAVMLCFGMKSNIVWTPPPVAWGYTISIMQRILPPSQSAVVPKLIMMWTIDSSLMDQKQQTYKIWDHS